MENNVNFRQDLTIAYLSKLVALGNREEFDKFYQSVESYLSEVIKNSRDLELLNKVKDIVSFKTKTIGMNI